MKVRLWIFGLFLLAAFAAVFVVQTRWQLGGTQDPRFVRFLRRYDRRGDAARKIPVRGMIVDCRGEVLSAPVAGSLWDRDWPLGEAAVHPVGYFDRVYGVVGCERVLDDVLSTPGSFGSTSGAVVRLSIDARLQKRAYELLDGRPGAVVVLAPATGRIRALVSSPGFDPSSPSDSFDDEENAPAFDRALGGLYPPGSTFKPFIAAAALSRKLNPRFACPPGGYIVSANTPAIRDSEAAAAERAGESWGGYGRLDMADALALSSNVYFAQLGVALGPEAFNDTVAAAKLRDPFLVLKGRDISLESAACVVPDVQHRPPLAALAIGQGQMLLTPLAVAALTAAIADDGVIAAPTLLEEARPVILARPFRMAATSRVKSFMRRAVLYGTAHGCLIPGLAVCGKTGTAQNGSGADHAWFTCFAPERHPKLVVTVLVEHGGFGAQTAVPVAHDLLETAKELGYFYEPPPPPPPKPVVKKAVVDAKKKSITVKRQVKGNGGRR